MCMGVGRAHGVSDNRHVCRWTTQELTGVLTLETCATVGVPSSRFYNLREVHPEKAKKVLNNLQSVLQALAASCTNTMLREHYVHYS